MRLFCSFLLLFQAVITSQGFALSGSMGPEGSNIKALHALGLRGTGINIGLIGSQNVYIPHPAFTGVQIYNHSSSGSTDPNWHDTMLAGIIVSQGQLSAGHADDIGGAPGAIFHSMRTTDFATDALHTLCVLNNCKVIVTGVQWGGTANGTSFQTLLYDYYASAHNVFFANAAGNIYGTITSLSITGDAYNGVTTGGLVLRNISEPNSYLRVGSSSLPAYTLDGRRKPDVVAPSANQWTPKYSGVPSWANTDSLGGTGGATSWAAPHVAALAADLLSYPGLTEPNHLLIKAAIVNSTFPNINNKLNNPTTGNAYDIDRGYGRINGLAAYGIISSPRLIANSSTSTDQLSGWALDNVAYDIDVYQLNVPKGARLLVTLTWDRRIHWDDEQRRPSQVGYGTIQDGELTPYLANLDLEIYSPENLEVPLFGETVSNLNPIDNLEKCDIKAPCSGMYIVSVKNKTPAESAAYAMAFQIIPPIPGDFDFNYVVNEADLFAFAALWLQDGQGLDADLAPEFQHVDFADFAAFVRQWYITNPAYYQP